MRYWKKAEPGAKVAYGSITFNNVKSGVIEHGLGVTPTRFILLNNGGVGTDKVIVGSYVVDNTESQSLYYSKNGGVYQCISSGKVAMDNTNINLGMEYTYRIESDSYVCTYGGYYKWIAIAD